MKSLTIQNFLMLAFLFIGLGMFTTSCEDDPCEDVTCLNGGTCENGDCNCKEGYEGETCETEVRAKFLGNYDVDDDCLSNDGDYTSSIVSSGTDVQKLLIENLGNFKCNGSDITFEAEITSSTTFDIIQKDYCGGDELSGSAEIDTSTDRVTIDYTFKPQSGSNISCEATYNLN